MKTASDLLLLDVCDVTAEAVGRLTVAVNLLANDCGAWEREAAVDQVAKVIQSIEQLRTDANKVARAGRSATGASR